MMREFQGEIPLHSMTTCCFGLDGKKMPLFVVVGDIGEVRTLKLGTAEGYIEKYMLVVVFSARLKVQ